MSISEIINIALPVLLTSVIIPLLLTAGKAISRYFQSKVENEKLQKYFDQAVDAIETAVADIMQTFVLSMKQSGEWNEAAAKKAFELAKLKAQELMGVAALQALPGIVGDVEAWLTAKIEAATLKSKVMALPVTISGGSNESK